MNIPVVKFAKDHNEDFYKVLQKRVNDYFKNSNIARHGNAQMFFKSIVMVALYLVPYFLMLFYLINIYLYLYNI